MLTLTAPGGSYANAQLHGSMLALARQAPLRQPAMSGALREDVLQQQQQQDAGAADNLPQRDVRGMHVAVR